MNKIMICYCLLQVFELCHFFIRYICCPYVMILPCILFTRQKHTLNIPCVYLETILYGIVACRPIAKQRPWNEYLYNNHCSVTALKTSMFPRQQENTAVMGKTFSVQSIRRCYNQDQLSVAVREILGFSRCDLLLWEAGSWGQGQFRNLEEGERPPLEAGTKQLADDVSHLILVQPGFPGPSNDVF
jgi:hypothetical protein